jgi:hypothetical protein
MEINEHLAQVISALADLQNRQEVLETAVMQLLELLVKPDPALGERYAAAMRQQLAEILQGRADVPHAESDKEVTLLLAALLTSAGRPPRT